MIMAPVMERRTTVLRVDFCCKNPLSNDRRPYLDTLRHVFLKNNWRPIDRGVSECITAVYWPRVNCRYFLVCVLQRALDQGLRYDLPGLLTHKINQSRRFVCY